MSTRIHDAKPDFIEDHQKDPDAEPLRLGRRESEPHSAEVTYLYNVLSQNIPNSRTFWDLHHYFIIEEKELDLQFDISLFLNFNEPCSVSSYKASEYENRKPDMVINVLSTATWRKDFLEIAETCELLGIPIYIIFAPYEVTSKHYAPPFMRVYILNENGQYEKKTVRQIATKEADSSIDRTMMVALTPYINNAVGLEQLNEKHKSGSFRYRLFFLNLETNERLLTKEEKMAKLFEKEKKRADEEKKRADEYYSLLKKNNLI